MEDFLSEPVWPTNPGGDTETAPAGNSGDEEGAGEGGDAGTDGGADSKDSEAKDAEAAGADKADGTKEPEKEGTPGDEPPKLPETRRSKLDFILARKQKQLEREREKAEGKDPETDDSDDDDGVAPEDAEQIDKVIRKKYGEQFAAVEQQRFENEVESFFQKNDIAKHATEAERAAFAEFATHPTRVSIPFETVILEVMGWKRLMEIGASIEREAAKKAGVSKSWGGTSQRQDGASAKPDYLAMPVDEFEAEQHRIRTGGR